MPSENIPGDPTDLAMFASLRTSIPLMSLLYSKELNSGPDAERFAQQVEYDRAMAERRRDALVRRAIELRQQQELNARVPPEVQRWYMNSRYDPSTATRRVDYEQPPARNFGSPGAEMRATPRGYQKGGGARKTVQQMADELMAKGTRVVAKDAPDIGRRALFGLRPQLDMPLARIHPDIEKAVESRMSKALKNAPQETTKSVEVNPATGSIKSTLQSVAGTPLSRRTVLSATAGQALRHMVPGLNEALPTPDILGEIAKIADVAKPVQAATRAATITPTIGGLLAEAIKMGLNEDQAVKYVHSMLPNSTEKFVADHLSHMYPVMKNPYDELSREAEYFKDSADEVDRAFDAGKNVLGSPLEILGDMVSPTITNRGMNLRPTLRGIREADPEKYKEILEAARDAATYLYEP